MKKTNAIVYCVDINPTFCEYVRYSISSIRKFCSADLFDIYVITPDSNKYFFGDDVHMISSDIYYQKYNIDNIIKDKRTDIPKMAILRIIIPLIPEFNDYNKILYLDCDVEIIKSIDDIFDIEFNGDEMLGRNEYGYEKLHHKILSEYQNCHDIKFPYLRDDLYVNAGVVLINNSCLSRQSDIESRILQLIEFHNECDFTNFDQDMINIGFLMGELPQKYNAFTHEKLPDDLRIIHYICDSKSILNRRIRENG